MSKIGRNRKRRGTIDHPRLWGPLMHRFQDLIEWALDIAVTLAGDFDEEIAAIERVRAYVRAWLSGRRIDVEMDDVFTTLAILFAAIEIDESYRGDDADEADDDTDTEPMLAPHRTCPHVRLPGADHDRVPSVVIRRFPRHRNGGALFTQLAA